VPRPKKHQRDLQADRPLVGKEDVDDGADSTIALPSGRNRRSGEDQGQRDGDDGEGRESKLHTMLGGVSSAGEAPMLNYTE